MTQTEAQPPRRGKRTTDTILDTATLARWQIRQVWKIFVLVALGMIASVTLVGTVPLLSRVSITANARSVFTNSGLDTTSHVDLPIVKLDTPGFKQTLQQLQQNYKQYAGPFFDLPPQLVFHFDKVPVYPSTSIQPLSDQILMIHGYDIGTVAPHLKILQGRLPQPTNDGLEMALTQDNAAQLGAHVGSTYTIYASLTNANVAPPQNGTFPVTLKVVGILQTLSVSDEDGPFWHGDVLDLQQIFQGPYEDGVLVSNPALFTLFPQLSAHNPKGAVSLAGSETMDTFFPLDTQAITDTNISQLSTILASMSSEEPLRVANQIFDSFRITVDNNSLLFQDQQIGSQTTVGQIPMFTILALMFGLLLLFVTLMVELLVTQQAEAIAVMRSRGAKFRQIFPAFVGQSLLLGLLAIAASVLLVPSIIRALVIVFLPASLQQSLNILPITPWETLSALDWYPWIAAALATLAMCAVVWRSLRSSTLGRSTLQTAGIQRPFWQRLYADIVCALLGLLTYGIYTYLVSLNVLDAQTQIVLAGPCMLVTAALLCLAGGLLFLRIFPVLVRLGARATRSSRGLVPYFPLVNMARAPRHALRSALLLTFTLIFALFAQIFFATQQQHIVDVANYTVPSDVTGFLPDNQTGSQGTFAQQEALYQHIPGVQAAALAFVDEWIIANNPDPAGVSALTVIATDPSSFGGAINWPAIDHQSTVQTMLAHLSDQHAALTKTSTGSGDTLPAIPALVSAATANLLHLSLGTTFSLQATDFNSPLQFIDAGELPYLPGIAHIGADQGILVDYASFAAAYTATNPSAVLNPTTAWIHIQPGAGALARVLPTLTNGSLALSSLTVHQTVLNTLSHDPLTLILLCLLVLGIGLALLLAWVGCLVSAWLSVRARLRGLLALRALGTTPRQLGWLLAWEQALIFASALILGIAGGAAFTALALPNAVLSSIPQISWTTDIFQIQLIPLLPVLPATLWVSLGVLILLCVVAIGLTGRFLARLSPAQMLRLSEDYVEEAPLTASATQPEKEESAVQRKTRLARKRGLGIWGEANLARSLTPVRRSWGLLGLAQVGIALSVLFFCGVPLFSQVAGTAGLQTLLNLPTSQYVTVANSSTDVIPFGKVQTALTWATATLNRAVSTRAAGYVAPSPIIALTAGQLVFTAISPDAQGYQSSLPLTLNFDSLSARSLPGQVQLVQGQWPQPGKTLQILLTPQAAAALHVSVGGLLTQAEGYPIPMRLVGLFQPRSGGSQFFPTSFFSASTPQQPSTLVTALTSTEALGPAMDVARPAQASTAGSLSGALTWYYPLNHALTSTQLDGLVAALSSLHAFSAPARSDNFTLSAFTTPLAAFQQYQQREAVSSIPILYVSLLIIALLLLFLSFLVDLFIEREANTIATLRSRGATRGQICIAFLNRTLVMSGLGLLGGISLALPVLLILTHLTLQPGDQQAGLRLLTAQPWQCVLTLLLWGLASTAVTFVAIGVTLVQATRTDVLELRRETARATRKAHWQRWYLDGVVMVLALAAYGYTLYISNSGLFSPQLTVQVKAPLALAATLCLVLACILFLLRLFPLLLRLGARQAGRQQGVERMLALAQMARAPRQRLRTALLLLLTTAFVIFVMIFATSQNQHLADVAQYWAGADFSGAAVQGLTSSQVQAYTRLTGVTSAVAGHTEALNVGDGTVNVVDVDPRNFMHTIAWPGLSAAQEQTLIAELEHPDQFSDLYDNWENTPDVSAAILDAQTAQALQVARGQVCVLDGQNFLVVAIVPDIPTVNDSSPTSSVTNSGGISGMLVDYQEANLNYMAQQGDKVNPDGSLASIQDLSLNYLWLKTDGRPQSLQHVRQALTTGPLRLNSFYDRQASMQALNDDPLNRDLTGVLALGALAPLLLTWVACLMASWIDVRQRQLLMGVLRALGTTPRQLMKVLAWEQGLTFGAAILLGTLFGLLTAFLALPSLVLTSVLPTLSGAAGNSIANGVQDLFSLQGLPPAHVVLPPALVVVVALLGALGVLAVFLMARSASRLSLGQMLRLNED